MKPEVVRRGVFSTQVCVPKTWADEQVVSFANSENPCGTTNGWFIRRAGDDALSGDPERNQCALHADCVHVMLDA